MGRSWSTIYCEIYLWLLQFLTLYLLEVWATYRVLYYDVVFLYIFFSLPFISVSYVFHAFTPFLSFILSTLTLKDCEESVPAEEPSKSMDHSLCDRACELLCTVDCMSGHVFLWMLQLHLFISLHFVIGSPIRSPSSGVQNCCLTIFTLITESHNYTWNSWDAHFVSLIWSLK